MRKTFLTLTSAFLTALLSFAAQTPAPEIVIENVGNFNQYVSISQSHYQEICFFVYRIEAVGEGDVRLYVDGEEVSNPYDFSFGQNINTCQITATAQNEGESMGVRTMDFRVPAIPIFYMIYEPETESYLMDIYTGEDVEVQYKLYYNGTSYDWQTYEDPFEVWRAPQPIMGRCTVEVIAYANGWSSNMGILLDLGPHIGGGSVFRYGDYMDGFYYPAYNVYDVTPETPVITRYDEICNKYVAPSEHPACYSGDLAIPENVERILENTFENCPDVTSISIPYTVTEIGEDAFLGCTGLERVEYPNLYDWCSSIVFSNAKSNPLYYAEHFVLDDEEVGDVKDLVFSRYLEYIQINPYAFAGYKGLSSITCESTTPPDASMDAFADLYDSVPLYVPNDVLEDYRRHEEWGRFAHIVPFIGAGPGDVDGDGVIAIDDVTNLIDQLLNGEELPAYVDVDGDGTVDISDVTMLIDMLLGIR
jgi:hypothetical protein